MKKIAIVTCVLLLLSVHISFAHPGRTDSRGGHNCSEQSKAKGLCSGYHYHNGGSTSSTTPSTSKSNHEKIAAEDKKKGEKDGASAGLADGYKGVAKNSSAIGSSDYNNAYSTSYDKAYELGKKQLQQESNEAFNVGYSLGKEQDELIVPKKYSDNELVKEAFINGYNRAVDERAEAIKKEYEQLGLEDGKRDIINEFEDIKTIYMEAYREGYDNGQELLRQEYYNQGYAAAFTLLEYKTPSLDNLKYIGWYKEGFESNREVEKIQTDAFEIGKRGNNYEIPYEYVHAEPIFKYYYDLGQEQQKKDNRQRAFVMSVLFLGWIGRRFYVVMKMIK